MKTQLNLLTLTLVTFLLLFVLFFFQASFASTTDDATPNYNIYILGEDRSLCGPILSAAGHVVTLAPDITSLTLANLSVYDQVWFVDTKNIPEPTGRANLINFIKSGGKIFFMGDSYRWYRADVADWRDDFFNELGAGGVKQSETINPSQEAYYTNPYHVTSYSPHEVHYTQHGSGRNGSFENTGNGTVIVGAGIDAKGDAIAVAFEYGNLLQAANSRAVIYLNSNNTTNWELYAENIAKFLGPKGRAILSVRDTKALPGGTGRMKIDLHNIRTVSGVQFKMKIEPYLLTPLQFSTSNRTINFTVSYEEDIEGFLRVVISSDKAATIAQGTGTIGELVYQVSTGAVQGDSADINLSDEIILDEFGEILISDVINGKFRCGILKGDVIMDGVVNLFDLIRTIDIILGRPPDPTASELESADFNSDGVVNILDVVGIINVILGREPGASLSKSTAFGKMQNQILNNKNLIPLPISCDRNLIALQACLRYNTETVKLLDPILSDRSSGMEMAWENQDGKVTILLYSLNGAMIKPGNGAVINFPISSDSQINGKNPFQIENIILVDTDCKLCQLTGINEFNSERNIIPGEYSLSQNYPNPFNSGTEISYFLPKSEKVNLAIYNLLGENIITLVNKQQTAGHYHINWNGQNNVGEIVPSGIYLYRLFSDNFCLTKKLTIIK
ncbi:T9SS type A sorting domain-containing protein [candidate division KSB1 bacterium]|nr:T9SS type A sorting domain-containing protein [candidate division KSB1 bacterium]MBL7095297.1 T9SS type A sorting domain-containing protein [candidate division KSB1 bacterium]